MTDPSNQLFELLKDPIRSRIMFEFMINKQTTIKSLSQIINKDRTTINYHLNMFLEAGIVKEVDRISHSRGKPTIVYGLSSNQYKIEKEATDNDPKDQLIQSLMDQIRTLNMLSAVSEQSHDVAKTKHHINDTLSTENHMLIMNENDIHDFYNGLSAYLSSFMKSRNNDSTNSSDKKQKYVFYAGFFPIIREAKQ